MGLRLVPDDLNWDYFKRTKLWLGISGFMMVVAFASYMLQGLNYGIDFRGGTSIRTEASQPVDVGAYRAAIAPMDLGDVLITEVFDPTFGEDENVAMIRIQSQEGGESVSTETLAQIEAALKQVDESLRFTAVESVGPKVSGELITTAIIAVVLAVGAMLFYIWLRFEWQFALGAVVALVHDVLLTIGIFSELQIRFDLAIIAALLTIVGYSINDTVIVFDRVRENLRRYKTMPLKDVLNMSINETMSRTVMTSGTTLLALVALFILGGDVIRGFVFAMIWGIVVGTYSSIFVASALVLRLGVDRNMGSDEPKAGTQFAEAGK